MKTRRFVAVLIAAGVFISSSCFAQTKYHHPSHYYPPVHYYPPHYYPVVHYYPPYAYRPPFAYVHPYVTISYGGIPYYYQGGYFYRPYGSVVQFVYPPIGIQIATLPPGYFSFYMGPNPFFYFNGIFYQPIPPLNNYNNNNNNNNNSENDHTEYKVVKPPLGAVVNKLPSGAKVKVIDGQKYYELNGTFYQEQMDENNKLSYVVVGTDGVLNTNPNKEKISEPQIGDRIDNLPSDSKSVVINGEKLYSTPSGLYYKKVTEGDNTYYELVGK